ncbi:MAG TPA: hypothetical protein VI796_04875, partial [Candidatus Thermoplasmatota archaeon]|nr:hypothetical protein [Candidatus Thermoplasmatota archaeon]
MGAFQNFSTSLRLTGASFRLLFRAPGVLLLPLGTLLWTGLWAFGPASFFLWLGREHPQASLSFWKAIFFPTVEFAKDGNFGAAVASAIVEGYILYAIWLTIVLTGVLFFLTVGMDVATQQIRRKGRTPSMREAFGVAGRNLGRLFGLALFNATVFAWISYTIRFGFRLVTLPLSFVPVLGRIARRAIMAGVTFVLTGVSYLMLPIIVYERSGPWNAMKSAWRNVKKTWAGLLIGTGGLFVAVWLLMNFVAWYAFVAAFDNLTLAMIFSLVTAAVAFAFLSASTAAMRATLYWYATTGEVPDGFRVDDLPRVQPHGPLTGVMTAGLAAPGLVAPSPRVPGTFKATTAAHAVTRPPARSAAPPA